MVSARSIVVVTLVGLCACSGEDDPASESGAGPKADAGADAADGSSDSQTQDGSEAPDAPDSVLTARAPDDLYVFECGEPLTVHALSATSGFKQYSAHLPAALDVTCGEGRWTLRAADWNRDGFVDVLALLGAETGTQSTEVHVLDGASDFKSFALQTGTRLEEAGTDGKFAFEVGDYDGDGTVDLYAIKKSDVTATEVHVLDGATNFQEFLLQVQTPLQPAGTGDAWSFALGDYNDDGNPDLICIERQPVGNEANTVIHVLDGSERFDSYLLETSSALEAVGAGWAWAFSAGDFDSDGRADLYAIDSQPVGGGRTTIHVLGGNSQYGKFLIQGDTAQKEASDEGRLQFDLEPPRSWLSPGPKDERSWDEIPHPLVFVGHGDAWELPTQHPDQWAWVRDNADGLYINFIITDFQMQTAAKITEATAAAAALMKHKQLFYEADELSGTMANDQRNLDAFQAAGLTTTHASYNYTTSLGWDDARAQVLRNQGLMPGQAPRPALVLLAPWELSGDILADTPFNAECRHQLLDLADGFATDGPLGYYYANFQGYREALDSLMSFARANDKSQAVMLAPYAAGIAEYSSAEDFLSTGIQNILQLESNGGSPDAWAVWEYADSLPAVPEANPDGSAANTTMGMAYWLIRHLQGDGVGLEMVSRASSPTTLEVSFSLVNDSSWLVTSPLLQADVNDPSGLWEIRFMVDGQDATSAMLAKTPGAYFAGGNSLTPGDKRSVVLSASCTACTQAVKRPEVTITAFGHLDARRVAQQWLVR